MNASNSLWWGTWTSFLLAAGVNYLLCIAILFRHKARWSGKGELLAYIATLVIMGTLDYVMTKLFIAIGIAPVWSKGWATLLGFIGNFLLRRYLVFPEQGTRYTQ